MNICVVGCGAMGSIYAALLAKAGNQVCVLDTNLDQVDAINGNGLRVWGASGDTRVHIQAFSKPPTSLAEPIDLVVCAVKARFAGAAGKSIVPLLSSKTKVLTIQNGLGSAEVLANLVGPKRLVVGIAQGFGASLPEPGVAHHNDMKAIRMGAYQQMSHAHVQAIAELWANAGFDAAAAQDIAAMQWEKLICNVAYSAPCAISGQTLGEVLEDPQMSTVSSAAAEEAYTVARATKINLSFDNPQMAIRQFAERMPDAKPSVLLDLEAGRLSEVDVINGAIPLQAEKVGLEAPVNATLTALVLTLEKQTLKAQTAG